MLHQPGALVTLESPSKVAPSVARVGAELGTRALEGLVEHDDVGCEKDRTREDAYRRGRPDSCLLPKVLASARSGRPWAWVARQSLPTRGRSPLAAEMGRVKRPPVARCASHPPKRAERPTRRGPPRTVRTALRRRPTREVASRPRAAASAPSLGHCRRRCGWTCGQGWHLAPAAAVLRDAQATMNP